MVRSSRITLVIDNVYSFDRVPIAGIQKLVAYSANGELVFLQRFG